MDAMCAEGAVVDGTKGATTDAAAEAAKAKGRDPEVGPKAEADGEGAEGAQAGADAEEGGEGDVVDRFAKDGYEPFRAVFEPKDVETFVGAVVKAVDGAVGLGLGPERRFGPYRAMVEGVLSVAVSMAFGERGPGRVRRADVERMLGMEADGPLDADDPDGLTLMGAYMADAVRGSAWNVERPCWVQEREGVECPSRTVREYTAWRNLPREDREFALGQAYECVRYFGPGYEFPEDREGRPRAEEEAAVPSPGEGGLGAGR